MCTFLSISYKDVLTRVLLFTYCILCMFYVKYMAHSNGYLHIHILLFILLKKRSSTFSSQKRGQV